VISFSDDDSGSDIENKGTDSRLERNNKRPSSSLENSNKLQLQQNARSLHNETPKFPSKRTFISSVTKNPSSISKGAGSWSLGQGPRARNFKSTNKTLASQERGRDQGAVSNNNKLQDLRHQIALRESELKLKAAQQMKESALVLDRDPKNDTTRKHIPAAQLEPKGPDRKRMKINTSHDTPQAVVGQQVPVVKSILPSKDSVCGNIYPQERNKVDHNPKEIPLCRGESIIIKSQRETGNHLSNSVQNMPCVSREGKYFFFFFISSVTYTFWGTNYRKYVVLFWISEVITLLLTNGAIVQRNCSNCYCSAICYSVQSVVI
jgi:hypothetical protein